MTVTDDISDPGLRRSAEGGDPSAQIALGLFYEEHGKTADARNWFARAASKGDIAARRLLGRNLLTQIPVMGEKAVPMIRSAAQDGDAEATYLCALLAAQDYDLAQRWDVARDLAKDAATKGWPLAREEENLFERIHITPQSLCEPVPLRMAFAHPRIAVAENFLSAKICDWLIARSEPLLTRAEVYDPAHGKGRQEDARNNSAANFTIAQSDLVLTAVRARILATITTPGASLEKTSILHYRPGERFEPHYDFLDDAIPAYAGDIAASGQRAATFLIYLNEGFEGGETEFPKLDFRYKGRKGDALLFWNIDAEGKPETDALHAGLPPTSGEKWLLSQWIRTR